MTFKETQELAALPEQIDAHERERAALYASLSDPAVTSDGAALVQLTARLATLDAAITDLIARWETLETLAADS
jgi:ATP-binding cassette subfamily F protein uup